MISEADKLLKSLLNYAKVKRDEEIYGFTEILASFYKPKYNEKNLGRLRFNLTLGHSSSWKP